MSANDAHIIGAFGGSESGKSSFVKQCLRELAPTRLMVWDPMDEYGEFAKVCGSTLAMVRAASAAQFRIRYVPEGEPDKLKERFAVFCSLAYALGNTTIVVEELQQVTTASWAPAAWSNCTLRGRHKGLWVFGVSQRPASVDKNFFSNATLIRSGRLNFDDDIATMDKVLAIKRAALVVDGQPLLTVGDLKKLHYVQRDMKEHVVTAGILTFPATKTAAKQKKSSVRSR